MNESPLFIIYDGECAFCNKTVQFINKNDKNNTFQCISSQSDKGIALIQQNNLPKTLSKQTIILIQGTTVNIKSEAVHQILLKIPKYKLMGSLLGIFPLKLSDFGYDIISSVRKHIIKPDHCERITKD